MKKGLKRTIAGALVGSAVIGGSVWAASNVQNIEVLYDNIKIYLDGELVEPKDANGQTVEPFVYNGTTYLPVRAVGNAIGKEVAWDGVEKAVYLGARPGSAESWLNVCAPYQYKGGEEYKLEENKYFTMSGKKYTNGYTLYLWNPYQTAEALYNLDGKYKSVSFTVGHLDGTTNASANLNIYLDGIIAYTAELKYDDIAKKITVPLDGALQMKIELTSDEPGNTYDIYYGLSEGSFEELK